MVVLIVMCADAVDAIVIKLRTDLKNCHPSTDQQWMFGGVQDKLVQDCVFISSISRLVFLYVSDQCIMCSYTIRVTQKEQMPHLSL